MTIFAEQYDFVVTLLFLESQVQYFHDADREEDAFDKFYAS